MQAGFVRGFNRAVLRFFNRSLLLSLVVALPAQAADVRQTSSMSPSVVLVLKLVSATHVKPVTGIVVSDDGIVLVPADFVSDNGEIVVLDGGTDIFSNGRPATIINKSEPGGLAVLSVKGLKRPAFILSENTLSEEDELHLAAFPPAEYIAKGAQPLWIPIKVLQDDSGMQALVSPETPLPYVTGALIDGCGYLAGLSLTSGAQSLEPGNQSTLIFGNELRSILESVEINLAAKICKQSKQATESPANTQDSNKITSKIPAPQEPLLKTGEAEPPETDLEELPAIEIPADPHQGSAIVPVSSASNNVIERPALWRSIPPWIPVLGIIILGVLVWKGIFFFRLSGNAPKRAAAADSGLTTQKASEEPDTAQLQAGIDSNAPRPRSVPFAEDETPDMNALPPGCNGVLVIDGLLDTDTPFKRYCAVNTEQINIVIGRGDADISIEHRTISRAHARLESDAQFMTLSDLGSSNGTFINGVPCLHGEIMFIEAEQEVFLGEIRFRIQVVKTGTELS